MKIDFYFDFLSPYSYLAWAWLRYNKKLIEGWGYSIELYPVSLAKIIKSYETKGPMEIASKRNYLLRDCMRFCARNNIPFQTPEKLPFNSQSLLKIAESQRGEKTQWEVIDTLYKGCWEKGLSLEDSVLMVDLLYKAGLEGEDLIANSKQEEVKHNLENNFKQATDRGVFGLPTFYVEGEIFWGNDSIPSLISFLKKEDILDRKQYKKILKKHNF